jgi:Uma2 family endonuclease
MPGSEHVNPVSAGVKLTYDDFVQFPDDGRQHELIDGVHYVTPSPGLRHQRISGNLHLLIGTWLEAHPIGRVFYSPLDVVFSRFDVVEPDLLYVSNARGAEVFTEANIQGSPELVVEIGSPSTRRRDETIKLHLYERMGVDEYWVVDPVAEAITVYSREGQGFRQTGTLTREAGDTLATPLLPGLPVPLDRVFRD